MSERFTSLSSSQLSMTKVSGRWTFENLREPAGPGGGGASAYMNFQPCPLPAPHPPLLDRAGPPGQNERLPELLLAHPAPQEQFYGVAAVLDEAAVDHRVHLLEEALVDRERDALFHAYKVPFPLLNLCV